MKRALFVVPFLMSFAVVCANAPVAAAKDHKISVCHIPPGNPDNAHEIYIDTHAVPAHLEHGDNLGICGLQPM